MQAARGLPSGIERLHPSWIEAVLASEPPDLLAYWGRALPEVFGTTVERLMGRTEARATKTEISPTLALALDRLAFGHLAPLCEGDGGPLAARLCSLGFDELHDEVIRTGARTLGQSLAGTDAATRARAMALAGEPWAQLMADAFAEKISDDDRKAARMHAATNIRASAVTPSERLLHIGLAALKARLSDEHAGSVFRVAGRLPAHLGRQLLDW
jgi:hypothetical protein